MAANSTNATSTEGTAIPSFDSTLGALYLGYSLECILYGVTCVQMLAYAASKRSAKDGKLMKTFVALLLWVLDTSQTVLSMMGFYSIFVSSLPSLLFSAASGGKTPSGPEPYLAGIQMLDEEAAFGIVVIVLVQLFFARRVWSIGWRGRLGIFLRYFLTTLIVILALFTFGMNIIITLKGFQKRSTASFFSSDPSFALWWKLSFSGTLACDVVILCAMVTSLRRSRTGIAKTDHVLDIITVFAINTGLATTVATIAALVQYLVLPSAIYYVGIALFIPKSYCNSALAALNTREFLRQKLVGESRAPSDVEESVVVPDFCVSANTFHSTHSSEFDSIRRFPTFDLKRIPPATAAPAPSIASSLTAHSPPPPLHLYAGSPLKTIHSDKSDSMRSVFEDDDDDEKVGGGINAFAY